MAIVGAGHCRAMRGCWSLTSSPGTGLLGAHSDLLQLSHLRGEFDLPFRRCYEKARALT